MRICFIGPSRSSHLIKICNWFILNGDEVHVISFEDNKIAGCLLHYLNIDVNPKGTDCSKIKYLFSGKKLKNIVKQIQPDIISVHYASSYGTVMAFSGIKHYILSVWGSDIYEFPTKSIFHKKILGYSLKKAEYLFSTSKVMAKEASKYTDKSFVITPFGVNMNLFTPNLRNRDSSKFVIGTIKALSKTYGIDILLRAVALFKRRYKNCRLEVRIAGIGPEDSTLRRLARDLEIEDSIVWLGFITQEVAAYEWANMDVGVIPSNAESFGVSAIECESCGVPVVVSDAPGLMESTYPGKTSIVFHRGDVNGCFEAISTFYLDKNLRKKYGNSGREYVKQNFDFNENMKTFRKYLSNIANRNQK